MSKYLATPREPAGYLRIADGLVISIYRKPARIHLWMMRCLFGWKWEARG